jgi:hypothetical protein
MSDKLYELFGGTEVCLWVDPCGSIMLKAIEKSGDPVELNEGQAIELADLLRRLAAEISN